MPRSLPLALVVAVAASGCAASAEIPRTVPEAGSLDEGLRRSFLRALSRAAAGDDAGADRALAPLLRARPLHVPSHLLHQDFLRGRVEDRALAEEYLVLARELPGDANAEVLAVRAGRGTAEARLKGYQAAAVKDPAAPWPRIALATERTELARSLVLRAAAREREGFAGEGVQLREVARSSVSRARTEGALAVEIAPDLAAAQAAFGHALAVAANILVVEDRERRDLRAMALERMGRALELDPGDPRVLLGRAFLLQDADRGAEAQADLDAAAAAAPYDPVVLAARARNLEKVDPPGRAVEAWREAAAAAPDDPDIRLDLGSALARTKDWSSALAEYRRADALYAARGGERWKARMGLVTALVQAGLDSRDPVLLAEALEQLRAYRAGGGPDAVWAARMAEVLGE